LNMRRTIAWLVLLLCVPWSASAAKVEPVALAVCAPGYPGTTAEAQNAMNALAAALAKTAKWPEGSLTAAYFPGEAEGLARLGHPDAAVALVPLPFFLAHRDALALKPRMSVQTSSSGLTEQWTLVAKKGRVKGPSDLANMTVSSIAAYAPSFVRGVLGAWGRLPDSVKVEGMPQVLSTLRKVANGANVAVLLDGAQTASLASLPFAKDLEVVARSQPMPTALVATVGRRLSDKRWSELNKALLSIASEPKGAEALATIRMVRFAPLEASALAAATAVAGPAK
jgi:hypothetical protein